MKIEIRRGESKQWYWRMVSSKNGRILAHSEMYSSRAKAEQTVKSIKKELLG